MLFPQASGADIVLPSTILGQTELPALIELLDALAFGIAVVDPQRALLHASRMAFAMLGNTGNALQVCDGRLETSTKQDTAALQKAITSSCRGNRAVLVIGVPQRETDIAILPLGDGSTPITRTALVFAQGAPTNRLSLYYFARNYGLTHAEERLLAILSDGTPVKEAAAKLGCTPNTARTHVRHLLEKTGQASLRTLTSRVARLPPMAGRII